MSSSPSAIRSAVPVADERRRQRDHPGDQDDRRPRHAAVGLARGEHAGQDDRRCGQQAGDGGGDDAGREQHDHGGENPDARRAPIPSGTPRRSPAGSSTTRTSGPSGVGLQVVPGAAEQQRVTGLQHRSVREVLAARCRPRTTRSPLGVTIPGNRCRPMSSERGEITTSVTPRRALMSSVPSGSAYCSPSVRACSVTSGGSIDGRPLGQQPPSEQRDDQQRAGEQRNADQARTRRSRTAARRRRRRPR